MVSDARGLRRAVFAIVIGALAARALRAIGLPRVSRYVVDGPSMEPAFRSGDRVLVDRLAYRKRSPRAGDVVVLRDPERTGHVLLKRVATAPGSAVPDLSRVIVLGDNEAQSRDSRSFGAIERERIIGKALFKY